MKVFEQIDFEFVMKQVLRSADVGLKANQAPFAASIVDSAGEIVICEHNRVRQLSDPSAHAEIMAIREACRQLGSRDLSQFAIVSTCEPCPMCAAAIVFAGIRCVAFGASVSDAIDAGFTSLQLPSTMLFTRSNKEIQIHEFVLREQCRELLRDGNA